MFATTDKKIRAESITRSILLEKKWPLLVCQTICDYAVDKRGPSLLRAAIMKEVRRSPNGELLLTSAIVGDPDYCPGRYELWAQYTNDHLIRIEIRFISTLPGHKYVKRNSWTEPMHIIWNFMFGDSDSYSDHFSWVGPGIHQYTEICSEMCDEMMSSLKFGTKMPGYGDPWMIFHWRHMIVAQEAASIARHRLTAASVTQTEVPLTDIFHHKYHSGILKHGRFCCKASKIITKKPDYCCCQETSVYATFRDEINPRGSWCLTVRRYIITCIEYHDGSQLWEHVFYPDSYDHIVKGDCIWPFICGTNCHDEKKTKSLTANWDAAILTMGSDMSLSAIHRCMRVALMDALEPLIRDDLIMRVKSPPHKSVDDFEKEYPREP